MDTMAQTESETVNGAWLVEWEGTLRDWLHHWTSKYLFDIEQQVFEQHWTLNRLHLDAILDGSDLPYGGLEPLCNKVAVIYQSLPRPGTEHDNSPAIAGRSFFNDVSALVKSAAALRPKMGMISLQWNEWDIAALARAHADLCSMITKHAGPDAEGHYWYEKLRMISPVFQSYFIVATPYFTEEERKRHSVILVRTTAASDLHTVAAKCDLSTQIPGGVSVGTDMVRTSLAQAVRFLQDLHSSELAFNNDYRQDWDTLNDLRETEINGWVEKIVGCVVRGYAGYMSVPDTALRLFCEHQENAEGFQPPILDSPRPTI